MTTTTARIAMSALALLMIFTVPAGADGPAPCDDPCTPTDGLIGEYRLNGDATDSFAGHHGSPGGNVQYAPGYY